MPPTAISYFRPWGVRSDPPTKVQDFGAKMVRKGGIAPSIWPLLGKPPPEILALGGKIFGAKPQKFGAVGAVLENFDQIFEKSGLKMQ